ncbi:hypothetical protein L0244_37890 [bacterium]|nr:hypothetical protein [bacterium]MCI0618782.1 hypothetical protein [bacterium]
MNEVAKAKYLAFIPTILLIVVACVQIYLSRNADLTPWKGGGFGMFSTTDGNANRYLRVFVTGPQRSEEILIKPSLEDLATRAEMYPQNSQLEKLAKAILKDQQQKHLPVQSVRIEVWRIQYDQPTLKPTTEVIHEYTYSI